MSMSFNLSESVQTIATTLSLADRRILETLLFAPRHSASAGQLRAILGLSAVVQVNAAMGRIGRKVHGILGHHPDGLSEGAYEWWHVIATGQNTKEHGFVWQLRDEVVTGLLSSGYSKLGDVLPNEVVGAESFREGAVRQITVNAYERNPVARARCVEAYGAQCYICGFDFGEMYGALMEGFIHVHHIRGIASIGKEYEVNPIEDLRPICPNCHAVVHMTTPARSIDDVKALLALRHARPA